MTDARLFKLAQEIYSAEDLYYLAIIGLGIKDEAVAVHLKNHSEGFTMATYNVLKDWRKGQPNHQVAYVNMCDALRRVELTNFIETTLQ